MRFSHTFTESNAARFLKYVSDKETGQDSMAPFLLNTLRTGDADLRFYITTVQDG